ncbi:Rna editing complex protein MP61 [Leptomonas seymouri]|uniref:Rna editing complex protein MP61 n=1 Tax=Leptomonas seymouri TaxID=5684 RepID=A0A0N1I3V7_LEPSE|nr:Rna editing complex protein MP61 [Leptomonas seymouri]|eukprot:KPI86763.1 Rna editing complex protein MP61 [Leptomonas seymouri]
MMRMSIASLSTAAGSAGGLEHTCASNTRDNQRTATTEYFNFSTRNEVLRRCGIVNSRGGRRTRARGGNPVEEEQILRNSMQISGSSDPHVGRRPFRKEMPLYGQQSRHSATFSISVDAPVKRFLDMFCDFDAKRCKLCNESFVQWHLHASGIPHGGREGILLEMVRPFCGTPEEQVRLWNERLYRSTAFGRIPALSHPDNQVRRRKLKFLLMYLKDRGVLRDVFNVNTENSDAARSFEFERLEFIGDGVVKYILNNVHHIVFPVSEGGIRGRLPNFQFVMDGNEGLARGYDFLELQDLTLSSRVVSKFKSDVVETLFGELQFFLWSTQLDNSTGSLTFPFTKNIYALRAIAQHAMYETATVLFMYHVEYILGMLQRITREEQLQYVRADESLLSMQRRGTASHRLTRSALDDDDFFGDDDGYGGGGRYGGVGGVDGGSMVILAPTRRLMKLRVARAHVHGGSAAAFLESTNYGNYKRVVPIGGLLPRPFAREQLAVIPNYMPHVQRDESMTLQLLESNWSWSTQLDKDLKGETVAGEVARPASKSKEKCSADSAEAETAAYRLSPAPTVRDQPTLKPLSLPRLKDEELIAELL